MNHRIHALVFVALVNCGVPFQSDDAVEHTDSALATGERETTTGHFALEIDGSPAGFIKSIDDGSIKAEVVSEPGSVDAGTSRTRILSVIINLDAPLHPAVNRWIESSARGEAKSGAITDCNPSRRCTRFEFVTATATDVTPRAGELVKQIQVNHR